MPSPPSPSPTPWFLDAIKDRTHTHTHKAHILPKVARLVVKGGHSLLCPKATTAMTVERPQAKNDASSMGNLATPQHCDFKNDVLPAPLKYESYYHILRNIYIQIYISVNHSIIWRLPICSLLICSLLTKIVLWTTKMQVLCLSINKSHFY